MTTAGVLDLSPPPVAGAVDFTPELLLQATAAWRAHNLEDDGRSLTDLTGQGRHLLPGGVAGSTPTSNDPTRLVFDGERFLWAPGISGAYASVADEAALDITGDLDIPVDVAAADYTPGSEVTLAAKDNGTDRSWSFRINTSGGLTLYWWDSGGTLRIAISSAPLGAVDGTLLGCRAALDVDNGAGDHVVRFYTRTTLDGSWTQLGTDRTAGTGATTSVRSTAANVTFGALGNGGVPFTGKIYRTQVLDGIDGTTVLDVDFTRTDLFAAPYTSGTAVTGQTVTLNGRATLVTSTRLFLDGVDDWLSVADDPSLDAGTDQLTVVGVFTPPPTVGTDKWISKKAGYDAGSPGWMLYTNPGKAYISAMVGDGTFRPVANAALTNWAAAEHVVVALIRDSGVTLKSGQIVDASSPGLSTASTSDASSNIDAPDDVIVAGDAPGLAFFGAAIFIDRVLTAAEIAQVARELAYGEASVA